jgi:hypothetical protein
LTDNSNILSTFIAQYQLQKAHEFEHILVGIDDTNLVHMRYKQNAKMDLQCAQQVVQYTGELNDKKPLKNIIELAPGCSIEKDASLYSKSEEANLHTIADAIIVKNTLQQFLGTIYINFGKTCRPTKLFTSIDEAKKWLNQIH